MRLVWFAALFLTIPGIAFAQDIDPDDIDPEEVLWACSNVQNTLWFFDRQDPAGRQASTNFPYSCDDLAYDPLTNHLFIRQGGAGAEAQEFVTCFDATTHERLPYITDEGPPPGACGFPTPEGSGSITIDPYLRVLYSDGSADEDHDGRGDPEQDNCADPFANHDSPGEVIAYSLVPANMGEIIDRASDPEGAHSVTDGNHLTLDPTDRVLWSAPAEWADNIRPRTIGLGTVHARGGHFGEVRVTDLPTITPASSIGVDPDNRRIFLIPWNPPTHQYTDDSAPAIAEHPEAWYVHVYDMDSFEEQDILDFRAPPTRLDSSSHCGFNVDFKLFYDRGTGRLYETNFSDTRAMFYNLDANAVEEEPVGTMRDVYGFEAALPDELYDRDQDDDGIPDTIEVGASDLLDPSLNDQDPFTHSDPFNADTDGGGLADGDEDANHDGKVDSGETDPSDPTDEPGQDYDHDGRNNEVDNCRAVANADQADEDNNGVGNACEGDDPDHDGLPSAPNDIDNCDCVFNPQQTDTDGDGAGDGCSTGDNDGDTVPDATDNCICTPNIDQFDTDGNGVGDLCQVDTDGDGVADPLDNCPADANPGQEDSCATDVGGDVCAPDQDTDGVADGCDNCPDVSNPDQSDNNNDGVGAACSPAVDTCACHMPGLPTPDRTGLLALVAGLAALLVRRKR